MPFVLVQCDNTVSDLCAQRSVRPPRRGRHIGCPFLSYLLTRYSHDLQRPAQDLERVQRLLRQHVLHLATVERLAVDVCDLVAHLHARSGSGAPCLDLRDDVEVVEITAHLRRHRFA